jgi:predicted methyltransferase MtxX (methanogen marker protein 4)
MVLIPIVVVGALLFFWLSRANEIFCVSVRDGRVLVVRGRIPGGLLSDIRDVVQKPIVQRATIRGVKREHGARLAVSGIDEGREQRLRNIFRLYPISNLRAAPVVAQPTLGQILGFAWLAWLLDRR